METNCNTDLYIYEDEDARHWAGESLEYWGGDEIFRQMAKEYNNVTDIKTSDLYDQNADDELLIKYIFTKYNKVKDYLNTYENNIIITQPIKIDYDDISITINRNYKPDISKILDHDLKQKLDDIANWCDKKYGYAPPNNILDVMSPIIIYTSIIEELIIISTNPSNINPHHIVSLELGLYILAKNKDINYKNENVSLEIQHKQYDLTYDPFKDIYKDAKKQKYIFDTAYYFNLSKTCSLNALLYKNKFYRIVSETNENVCEKHKSYNYRDLYNDPEMEELTY